MYRLHKEIKTKYTLWGIGFGLLFPIFATLLDIWQKGASFTLQAARNAQAQNPVHWVVDTAPLILGLAFRLIGQRESKLIQLNSKLQDSLGKIQEARTGLEQRVQERTSELEIANFQINKRARQFEAITRVTQAVSTTKNLQEIFSIITEVISQQFGFYHVGIFLLDEKGEYAVLRASNSPGGMRMIEKGHRLQVGEVGIVGHVAASGSPRIALETGQDSVFFDNPDLPTTRSEIALPLMTGGNVRGILDVQSTEPSAFSNEDIATLSVLADQVRIVIENTRLYEATLKSFEQTEAAYRQYTQKEWARLAREEKLTGFQYAEGTSTPLTDPIDLGEIAQIVQEGNIHQSEADTSGKPAQLAVPIKLRGEVIGILNIETPQKSRWTDDDIDIAEAVVERLAFSIENARLFQTSANRATRERIVSDISSKISGNIRVETILRMAAQELSQALNGSDVLIQLQSPVQPTEVQQ